MINWGLHEWWWGFRLCLSEYECGTNAECCSELECMNEWEWVLTREWQPRSGPDRHQPTLTDFGPIGPVHLDLWDRLDRSFCSMITSLIRYVNTYCHATSYLFTTSKHIVIGCFQFTSSLCLCLQPCDKRLLLLRLTGTELKKFVGAKAALNGLWLLAEWLKEAQTAIEKMWMKLRKYYDKTDKPFAYVDATLLHPGLKKKFMKKARYSADTIETYVKKAEMRFQNEYDATQRVPHGHRPTLQGSKRRRPSTSDWESSDGIEYNEFSS